MVCLNFWASRKSPCGFVRWFFFLVFNKKKFEYSSHCSPKLERTNRAALCLLTFDIHWTLRIYFRTATIIDKCDFWDAFFASSRKKNLFSLSKFLLVSPRNRKISTQSRPEPFNNLLESDMLYRWIWDAESHDSLVDLTFSSSK